MPPWVSSEPAASLVVFRNRRAFRYRSIPNFLYTFASYGCVRRLRFFTCAATSESHGQPRAASCPRRRDQEGRRPRLHLPSGSHPGFPGFCHRLEERELPLTTAVEQTSGQLYARFETQLLCVERSGPLQILYRDPRRDLAVFKHFHRPPSYRVALDGIAGQVGRHPPNGGDPRGRLSRRPQSGYRRTRLLRIPLLGSSVNIEAAKRAGAPLTSCARRSRISLALI